MESREATAQARLASMLGSGHSDSAISTAMLAGILIELAALNDEIRRHSPMTVRHEVVEAEQ